jgi:hypothetical protein
MEKRREELAAEQQRGRAVRANGHRGSRRLGAGSGGAAGRRGRTGRRGVGGSAGVAGEQGGETRRRGSKIRFRLCPVQNIGGRRQDILRRPP